MDEELAPFSGTKDSVSEDDQQHSEEAGCRGTLAQDLTTYQAFLTPEFWLIMLQALIGLGTGLGFINNLSGQVVALGGQLGGQLVFVSLFSVANASGRMTLGYMSETFLHSRGTPRTM
jgi:hypothetical protein